MKLKINKSLNQLKKFLVIGGGRWGVVHALELFKTYTKCEVYLYTKINYNELITQNELSNKIFIINSLNKVLKLDLSLIILANRYDKNFLYLKKFSKYNFNILIEKPFLKSSVIFQNLYQKYQNNNINIALSTPWIYDKNLIYFVKKISTKNIHTVKFTWFSKKNIIKYNNLVVFDNRITHLTDIFSHILSFLICIFKSNKFIIHNIRYTKFKKKEKTSFFLFNKKIIIENSNNINIEKRNIEILYNSNDIYLLSYKNNLLKIKKNNRIIGKFEDKKNKLKHQYSSILKNKKLDKQNNYQIFNTIAFNSTKLLKEINK